MDCWNLLGIEPTVDTKLIKRAYAKLLKIYHPEDDPEGFHKLRECYEAALKEAKFIKEVKSSNISEDTGFTENNEINDDNNVIKLKKYNSDNFIQESSEVSPQNLVESFMNKVSAIYNDFYLRTDVKAWNDLLSDEAFFAINIKQSLNLNMLNFLMDNYNLPNDVWKLLNEFFFWSEEAQQLYKQFDKKFIDFILGEIYDDTGLRYNFKRNMNIDFDKFISLRKDAYYSLVNNNLIEAKKYFNAATEIYSEDADLVRMLGTYYLRLQSYTNALSAFSHLIEIAPKEIDGYLNRAYLFIRNKKINDANIDFQKVLEMKPDNVLALKGIAECHYYMNNFLEAKLLYEEVQEKCSYDLDIRVRILEINSKLIDIYNEDLTTNPNDVNTMFELAEVYFEMDYFDECCSIIKKIKNIGNLNSDMYLLYARAVFEMKKIKESINYFNKALEYALSEGENGYEILFHRGIAYYNLKNYDASIKDFEAIIKINKFNAEALYYLSEDYRWKDKDDIALDYINKAISINPSEYIYYSTRALLHFEMKNYEKSRDDHAIVVRNVHTFADAWYRKGYCHLALKEYEASAECFKEALDWNIESFNNTHLLIAAAYTGLLKYKEAISHINTYLTIKPHDANAFIILGDIYRLNGDLKQAEKYYLSALALNNNPATIKVYAYISLVNNNYKDAAYYFNCALEKNLSDENLQINLFWSCLMYNNNSNAIKTAEKYIELAKNNKFKFNKYALYYGGAAIYKSASNNKSLETAVFMLEKAIELGLIDSELYSYLSMIYLESDNKEKAVSYAEMALNLDPLNKEYKARLEGIRNYSKPKKFLFIGSGQSPKKLWPCKMPNYNGINTLPNMNVIIGE